MSAPQQQQPQPQPQPPQQHQQQPDRRPLSARLGIKLELLQPSSQESGGDGFEGGGGAGSRPLASYGDGGPTAMHMDSGVAAQGGGGGEGGGGAGGQQPPAHSGHMHHGGHHHHHHHHHHRRGGPGAGQSGLDEAGAEAASRAVVARLKAAGVNLLALDFDMTVLDIHTGGRWTGKAQELAVHVRPFFRSLIAEAGRQGIHMAVVTFSPQTDMIREVLRERFGADLAMQIPVRGEDGSWTYLGDGSHKGKQGHMASAVEELQSRFPCADITRASTVLIDDDRQNIEVALKAGVRAFWLDPRRPDDVIEHLLQISSPASAPASASSAAAGAAAAPR